MYAHVELLQNDISSTFWSLKDIRFLKSTRNLLAGYYNSWTPSLKLLKLYCNILKLIVGLIYGI